MRAISPPLHQKGRNRMLEKPISVSRGPAIQRAVPSLGSAPAHRATREKFIFHYEPTASDSGTLPKRESLYVLRWKSQTPPPAFPAPAVCSPSATVEDLRGRHLGNGSSPPAGPTVIRRISPVTNHHSRANARGPLSTWLSWRVWRLGEELRSESRAESITYRSLQRDVLLHRSRHRRPRAPRAHVTVAARHKMQP